MAFTRTVAPADNLVGVASSSVIVSLTVTMNLISISKMFIANIADTPAATEKFAGPPPVVSNTEINPLAARVKLCVRWRGPKSK